MRNALAIPPDENPTFAAIFSGQRLILTATSGKMALRP